MSTLRGIPDGLSPEEEAELVLDVRDGFLVGKSAKMADWRFGREVRAFDELCRELATAKIRRCATCRKVCGPGETLCVLHLKVQHAARVEVGVPRDERDRPARIVCIDCPAIVLVKRSGNVPKRCPRCSKHFTQKNNRAKRKKELLAKQREKYHADPRVRATAQAASASWKTNNPDHQARASARRRERTRIKTKSKPPKTERRSWTPRVPKGSEYVAVDMDAVASMLTEHRTLAEIGDALGWSVPTIRVRMKRRGLKPANPHRGGPKKTQTPEEKREKDRLRMRRWREGRRR